MATKKGIWYHGTKPARWKKIQQDGWLRPHLADDRSFGPAIWFTNNLEEAEMFGGVILHLDIDDDFLEYYHVKLIHSMEPKLAKKIGLTRKEFMELREPANLLVFDPIPVEKLYV
jgi:hypothetical protein